VSSEATRILVAEDDDNDFFLLERAFSNCEKAVRLLRVRDGLEAMQYLAGENTFADREEFPLPQFILLDLKMPYVNGFEVLDWLQRREELAGCIPIVLSSSNQERDVKRAHELGARSYLVKPGSFVQLVQLIRTFEEYWLEWSKLPTSPGEERDFSRSVNGKTRT